MIVGTIFQTFMEKAPVPVMAMALIERVFNEERLDKWFNKTAKIQYTKTLLFSTIFNLMSQVVFKVQPAVNTAYKQSATKLEVSIQSVYNKLNCMENHTSAELVRYSAAEAESLIKELGGGLENPLPGYRIKILDGNCIEACEHRIKELRTISAAALPGKSLVMLDPVLRLMIDLFPCEDGHAQERSLLDQVLPTIEAADVVAADRNFCTVGFVVGIKKKKAFTVIREHKNIPYKLIGSRVFKGNSETGKVYQQLLQIVDEDGKSHKFRRITVSLNEKTKDGDTQIHILSNLPAKISAVKIAEIYRTRWKIETAFQELEKNYNSEINTLSYPKAAIFGFSVAVVTYNILSVMEAAMRNVHGEDIVENAISEYYIANEISDMYKGMELIIPGEDWKTCRDMATLDFAQFLIMLAGNMDLARYKKQPRGPKKKPPEKTKYKTGAHVSVAKILAERKKNRNAGRKKPSAVKIK